MSCGENRIVKKSRVIWLTKYKAFLQGSDMVYIYVRIVS